jgi:hypothetical protein
MPCFILAQSLRMQLFYVHGHFLLSGLQGIIAPLVAEYFPQGAAMKKSALAIRQLWRWLSGVFGGDFDPAALANTQRLPVVEIRPYPEYSWRAVAASDCNLQPHFFWTTAACWFLAAVCFFVLLFA